VRNLKVSNDDVRILLLTPAYDLTRHLKVSVLLQCFQEFNYRIAAAIDRLGDSVLTFEPSGATASEELEPVFDVQPQNFLHVREHNQLTGIA
jgi:hypothetical protein